MKPQFRPRSPSSNQRVFGACLLSFMTLIAPIASVGAATLRATAGPTTFAKELTANEKLETGLFEPVPSGPPIPAITATKTDTFPVHPSGQAQPGDEITYDIAVNNAGTDATNVAFNDTIDANTTLVPGSLKVSPVAAADSYLAEQNVALSVGAPGVLTNDYGTPEPTAVPIVAGPTTAGGTVTLNADGSFNYAPPSAIFTGADTFTYTATNLAGGGLAPDDTATVTITVDARPTVTATTPTNGASNQATNTNLTVTFSEPVNVTGTWFTISCTGSGAHTAAVSGGATTYTLNPDTDFTQGETCTVTIVAAQVTDVDTNDPPDTMAADYVFSFSMDAAPSVSTTSPTNGANGVPTNSNITLNFSESVGLGATPVTISCATSGAHTFVVSASPNTTFTINPNVDFAQNEVCTVTVLAAQVTDTDIADPPDNMLANYVFSFTTDAAPSVTSTTPTNGATNQTTNTDITLNFSESVSLGATPVTISCTTSGSHPSVVSASPNTTFTVNPNVDFAAGETCTVTVLAAQVTDTDTNDPPDNMLANYVFSFSIDAAPTVTTVTPTNGSTQVASNTNIVVNFSEPVNIVDATAFTVECPAGTPVAFSVTPAAPGATNSFTIDPTSDLPFGTVCTVTVVAAKVTDTDANDPPDNMAANFVFSFTVDSPPTVTTTTPANTTLSNAKATNTTVNFSENVGVTAGGVTINCGAGNLTFSGLPASNVNQIVLNPTADLPAGSTCTVTVLSANVTDSDAGDPPNNLDGDNNGTEGGDYVFTFGVAPDAVNDAYNSTGNIGIVIAANGVLANDVGTGAVVDRVGPTTANNVIPSGGSFTSATSGGGSVTLGSDGSFTYLPPTGQASGTDTFKYRISNSGGVSADATVTITITGIVWFICDACGGSNVGTLANPYTSINSFSTNNTGAANKPSAGQRIYIRSGTYDAANDNLTLLANQVVSGQGQAATTFFIPEAPAPAAYAALTASTRPIIAPTAGNAVTVANGNNISHFNIGSGSSATNAALLTGPTTGNWSLTAGNMTINGRGRALDLSTAAGSAVTLNATFDGVSTSSSTLTGITLTRVNGTLIMNGGAISGVTGDDVFMDTGTASVSYSGTITNTAAHSINVANKTGGTVAFSGAISDTATGVLMNANTGAIFNFTGGLSLSTTTSPAFTATGGGTVSATQNNTIIVNTISTTTGTGLNVANTNIGLSGLTFRSIASSGAASGIILNTTGTSASFGGLTVTGDSGSTVNASGGIISASTGVGISLNSTRDVNLDQMTIQNGLNDGINGNTVTNFTLTNSTVSNNGDALQEHGAQFDNLSGNGVFTNLTFTNNETSQVTIINTSGTADVAFSNVSLTSTGIASAPNGLHGIHMETQGTASADLRITGSSFNNLFSNSIHATNESTGTFEVTVATTTFNNVGASAINIVQNNSGTVRFNVNNNPTFLRATPIGGSSHSININQGGGAPAGAVMEGRINNNVIGNNTSSTSASSGGGGIQVLSVGSGTLTIQIDNNNIQGMLQGINTQMSEDTNALHTMNATIFSNTVLVTDANGFDGIRVVAGAASGDAGTLRADIHDNTASASVGNDFTVRPRFNTTLQLLNYAGGGTDTAAVQTYLDVTRANNATGPNDGTQWFLTPQPAGAFANTASVPAPTLPSPLMITSGGVKAALFAVGASVVSQTELDTLAAAAVARWAASGLTSDQIAAIRNLKFELADFPVNYLAEVTGNRIRIDRDAGGKGWFVDATPSDDCEFAAELGGARLYTDPFSAPAGRVDLLTAIEHEMGHRLGLGDSYLEKDSDSIMYGYLTVGERRLPAKGEAANAKSSSLTTPHFLKLKDRQNWAGAKQQAVSRNNHAVTTSTNPARFATTTAPVLNPSCGAGTIAICLGTLRTGKTVNIQFKVTINTPFPGSQVSNQGSVAFDGGGPVLTNDPDTAAPNDATVTPIQTCSAPPVPGNMSNWWTGDDTARDIAGGKDGTLNGDDGPADLEYSAGKVLNGFDFDGINDLVNVGDVDLPATFTIDAWVNPTNLSMDRAIVSKDDGATQRSYFLHSTSAGALQASVNSAGGFTVYQTADGVITAGSLQHVAVTYDGAGGAGAKMLFYKNGALVGSTVQGGQDAGGTPENNSLAALIGRSATTNNTFLGVIDEVEFFNVVLTAAQVLDIYSADAGGKCKPSDLTITKTHSGNFNQGSTGNTYTITVHNDGPGTTSGTTTVTDTLPAGLTATAMSGTGWTCTPLGGGIAGPTTLTCTSTDAIASGADFPAITLTVSVGVNTPSASNQVTVSGGGEMDTSDDTASDPTTLSPVADLAVTKGDAPDPVIAGNNITYTINFINNGPSSALGVSVTDAVPANTTFVSAGVTLGSGWGQVDPGVGNTGNVVFSKATVTNGETATFQVVVKVNAGTLAATITNSAVAAASGSTDPTSGNDTANASTTVNTLADLAVTKSDSPDPVNAGANLTYTINFVNNGPSNAQTVSVTDAVPANTTFVSASVTTGSGWGVVDPGVGNTGNVVFSKGSVANGETAVFQVVVKVNANTASGATITNSATAAATTVDPDSSNNTGTATTTVATEADLLVTKTDSPDPAVAGTNLTYSVTITNNGTSDAQGVSLTDAVPANTTFVSVSQNTGPAFTITQPPAGGTGNVSCTLATLAAGASANFSMVVKIDAGVANGTTITNSAVGATTTTDPNSSNNTATATTTVSTSADLAVTKGDAPDPVTAGNNLTYTINFVNNGPSAASTVTVTDAVPLNTTFVSAVVTTGTGWSVTDPGVGNTGNVVFSKGTVALGETAVFTMVVKVNASAASGSTISNTATAAGTSADPNNGNDSATATTTVNRSADLAVTKGDAPDPVVADANLTYTLNFVNNGPSDASTVTVTDAVPANTTFFSASVTTGAGWSISAPGVGGTGNVVFSKGTVAAGETAVFQVVVKVNAGAVDGSTISNSATAATTTTDPDNSNNTGTATTTVTNQADVSITKSDAPDPVVVSTNITYTLNFANNGPATANTVTVTDAVPVNTTFFAAIVTTGSGWSISAPGVGGTGNVIFSKASVPSGETAVFTIVVNVNPGTPHNTVITNTAVAANTTVDPDSSNNTAVTTTTVTSTLALTVNDSGDAADTNVGDRICDTDLGTVGDQCTLRAAIQETNAAVTNDTIDFSLPANTTIVLTSLLPDINGGDLVMTGPASGVTVSGNSLYRVFKVAGGNVQLLNLTIANGQASQGGGIFNTGNLTISNSTLTGNKAVGSEGGAIYSSSGTLVIINSTISGNTSDGVGGGLANAGTSTATLVNVTITNNRADADGNASGNGGGISQTSSNPITLRNTIVAGNFVGLSPGTTPDDINGTVDPAGNNNLIGTGGAGGLTNGVNNNQVGVVDARLGVLANNGGPTQTHALLSGSVALDAGDDSVTGGPYNLTTDQRGPGFPRKADGPDANTTQTVDIGAFEADPSVEDISDKATSEDTALAPFIFNVGDAATPFTSIVATSSNQTLVPDANLVVGPNTPSSRTLSITPAPNQFGTATITVTVTRGTQSMSDTFILTVNGVNDPPSFTKGPDQTVAEDSGAQSVANWATAISQGPGNESGQTLTFLVQNNTNPGLFSAGPAISPTGTLVYTPAANANGSATITIALMDNGGGTDTSASQSFQITVTEVNDAPDVVDDALSSVAEDSGPRTISIASLLANDSKGPVNESGQTLTLTAVSNPVGGTVTKDAVNVYFTPAADFNGPASFQYTITDNGTTNGAADPKQDTATVSFTVTEVNDAPTAVSETIPNLTEDSPQSIPFATLTANDVKGPANESGQTLIVKTVGNPVGGTVSINILAGNVVFTPAANYTGPGSFDYTVEDNGTTNGVADPKTSGVATASFTITSVNDAPVAVNDTLTSMAEDAAPRAIPFADLTANDSKGGPDESGQTLTVVSVGNAVGGTVLLVPGFVVFTPNGDYNGPASFTYTVQDNGTTNGAPDPKTSGSALVQFTITEVNDAPAAFNDTLSDVAQNSGERTIAFADLLANDVKGPADESGQTLTILSVGNPVGVTVSIVAGTVRVTPLPDFAGPAGFQYTVRDNGTTSGFGDEKTSVATVSFNVIGQGGGGGVLRFSAANYSVAEGAGFRTITVERTGDSSQAVTVDYASSDHSNPADFILCSSPGVGFASSRCDFTTAIGTLRFAAGETSKTFNVLISNDNYVEGPETLELTLSNPTGGAVFGVPQTAILTINDDLSEPGTNPIDTSSEFVRSQYHDFLNREPDAPGLAFWTDNIELCNDASRRPVGQTVAQCIDKQRESTAVAFFAAPEFQITGGFVYNLYKGSLTGAPNYDGGSPGASPGRFPTSLEFMRDVGQVSEGIVVNNAISGAVVEANRNRLAAEFVQRPEFIIKYGGLNNTLYVDELFNTTGITPTAAEKQALVDGLTGGTETRASVLRKVVDGTVVISEGNVQFTTSYGQAFINQENRRKFVFMEYIAYLRRNPDTPGFVFWLGKLNFYNGDPFQAEMVRSFILSPEYRNRFGQP